MMFVPIIALLSLCTVQSFPTGAPNATCTSMEPKHEVEAQKGVSPYIVSVNSTTVSSPARGITVTIESPKQEQFRGFFLQARFGNQTIGSFSVPKDSDAKFIDCDNKMKNAVTHSSNKTRVKESFGWMPPNNFQGQIVFQATVVQSVKIFWTNIKSPVVSVTKSV